MRKTLEGRGKLHEARAKQDQLNAARQTVQALQLAVEAGQQQVATLASSLPDVPCLHFICCEVCHVLLDVCCCLQSRSSQDCCLLGPCSSLQAIYTAGASASQHCWLSTGVLLFKLGLQKQTRSANAVQAGVNIWEEASVHTAIVLR